VFTPSLARQCYEQIFLIRFCEEAIQAHYSQDEMKTPVHLCIGQEAIAAGVMSALPPQSKIFGTYRNHGLYLMATQEPDGFFAELHGKQTGPAMGKAGSMHLTSPEHQLMATSAVVGTTIPVAVGAAFANQYEKKGGMVAVFFGDGAIEEGVFWESLNFASLRGLRILFVCEDNDLAIHTPGKARRGFRSFRDAVKGFRCYYDEGDGSRADVAYQKTSKLIQQMKKKAQPAFLCLKYYRFLEHVGVNEDFKFGYRKKPTSQQAKLYDPCYQIEKICLRKGIKKQSLEWIQSRLKERIEKSILKAKQAPFPSSQELYNHIFSTI